jgi:hypothetical protein
MITPMVARTRARSLPEKRSLLMAMAIDEAAAAPAAWSTLDATRVAIDSESPPRMLETMYSPTPNRSGLRLPNLSESGP